MRASERARRERQRARDRAQRIVGGTLPPAAKRAKVPSRIAAKLTEKIGGGQVQPSLARLGWLRRQAAWSRARREREERAEKLRKKQQRKTGGPGGLTNGGDD